MRRRGPNLDLNLVLWHPVRHKNAGEYTVNQREKLQLALGEMPREMELASGLQWTKASNPGGYKCIPTGTDPLGLHT